MICEYFIVKKIIVIIFQVRKKLWKGVLFLTFKFNNGALLKLKLCKVFPTTIFEGKTLVTGGTLISKLCYTEHNCIIFYNIYAQNSKFYFLSNCLSEIYLIGCCYLTVSHLD